MKLKNVPIATAIIELVIKFTTMKCLFRVKATYKCKNITHPQKLQLFYECGAFQDNVKQNSYLMELLNICRINRRRRGNYKIPDESRRQASVYFTVTDETVSTQTFLYVFEISRCIETLVKEKKV